MSCFASFLYHFSVFCGWLRHHGYGVCLINVIYFFFRVVERAALKISLIKVFANKIYNLFLDLYEDSLLSLG